PPHKKKVDPLPNRTQDPSSQPGFLSCFAGPHILHIPSGKLFAHLNPCHLKYLAHDPFDKSENACLLEQKKKPLPILRKKCQNYGHFVSGEMKGNLAGAHSHRTKLLYENLK